MLGIDLARIFHLDQLAHHRKHIHVAFIDEAFVVFEIRHGDVRIAIVHVVDAIAAAKVAAHFDRVLAHFHGHAAIEGNSIRGAVDDFDEVLPAGNCGHNLLRSPAQRKRRIIGMQREAHVCFFGDGNDGLEEIRDVGPHFIESMRALLREAAEDPSSGRNPRRSGLRRPGRSLRNSPPLRGARRSCIPRQAGRPGPAASIDCLILSISSSRPGRP